MRPLSSVRAIEVETHDWSDGAPSYSLKITMADGIAIGSAASGSREEVERVRARVEGFLEEHVAPFERN